ncbi:MAG TPA: hypothetical protein VKZ74_04070 [Natronosporangium sp.]|nr:hypothetical protein [Natronosporangium sp.]
MVSVVAVLLIVFGGTMTYFWLDTRDELDATRADFTAQVENLEGTIAQRDGQITDLQTQLDTARDDLQDLQTQLEGSQNEVEFLEEANEAISLCLDLINEWLFLIADDDIDGANDLFDEELEPACDRAEQYR